LSEIIIIIIIIRHNLDLNRHVSVPSNSLFKGPSSRLLPFDLYSYFIFCHNLDIQTFSVLRSCEGFSTLKMEPLGSVETF